MKKRCTKCKRVKSLSLFKFRKGYKNNRHSWCKSCHTVVNKAWDEANPERKAGLSKAWGIAHPEQKAANNKAWDEANPKRKAELCKTWGKLNRGKRVASAQAHRAAKLKAMPAWLNSADLKAIDKVYKKAAKLGLTVDHEIPLQGRGVCGLHVPWNLQLMTGIANSSKGRKYLQEGPK